jgi:hypothetical protein
VAKSKNPYLKTANEQYEYTAFHIHELQKCTDDALYFIDTYCQIQHAVEGSIPFKLREYQRRVLTTFADNRLSITLAPRQIGKSWLAGAFLLWYAMFKFEKTVLILSNKNDNAMEMIHRVRYIYERLPHWIKPGLADDGWNKHSCGFDNGSRIISQATSENSGRGMSISLLFLDEFAFVRDSVAQEFWTSVSPTLATGGSCIICSTPNGDDNLFAQLWRGAETNSNGYASCEVKWDEPPGRDDAFKEQETAKIGETKWLQEFECRFISSDPLLINTMILAAMTDKVKHNKPYATIGDVVFWKQPQPNTTYLVGVDPATGTGSDFTTFVAVEFPSLQQVAEFRSNSMSSVKAYQALKRLLRVFEKLKSPVYFSIENNGVGEGLIALYENDEDPPPGEFVSEEGKGRKGMNTNGKSKIKACLALKELVERNTIDITSPLIVKELKHYIRRAGSYSAKIGATDDLVSGLLIVVRLIEEMSTFDQQAYDTMYQQSHFDETNGGEWDDKYEPDAMTFG